MALALGAAAVTRQISAADHGLAVCQSCELLQRLEPGGKWICPRCGDPVQFRRPQSLSHTCAYLVAAAILYLPANLLPIMHTRTIVREEDDTIISGVIVLIRTGSWPLALLVFFASIVVPVLKLLAIGALVLDVHLGWTGHPKGNARLYRLIEYVGRWSMLDVYVVTLLAALVQLHGLAIIEPRAGAVAFGAVVVLTMLAARSFDPRLLWDRHSGVGADHER
jgi:paraquat-inducible protein A